jgi:hypothetical protein
VAVSALSAARFTDPTNVLTRNKLMDAFWPLKELFVSVLISDELTFSLRAFSVLTVSVLKIPLIVFSLIAVIFPTAIEFAVKTPAATLPAVIELVLNVP